MSRSSNLVDRAMSAMKKLVRKKNDTERGSALKFDRRLRRQDAYERASRRARAERRTEEETIEDAALSVVWGEGFCSCPLDSTDPCIC